jgi:hypothetical protein
MKRQTGFRAPVPSLPDPPTDYNQGWASSLIQSLRQGFSDVINGHTIKPIVKIEAARVGDEATMTVTVRDADRRVKAIEFAKREGSSAATGWVSTWDTSTGTIGTDVELVRAEDIAIPPGLDSAAEWRVKWRDQQGTEHIEGGPIPLSNLASVNKTLRIPHAALVPFNAAQALFGEGLAYPGVTATNVYFSGTVVLPQGVTITLFRARTFRATGSDVAESRLYRMNDDGQVASDLTGALTQTTTAAFETVTSAALSETVSTYSYTWFVRLNSAATAANTAVAWADITYTAPSYDKSY